ncbi:type II secretion system F family protein [Nocardioides sp. TRM66260-LWL]|uniref:type II secretion system F family protein n=1 Tax=Nocardioides sp. TRM66260-LWL TaxID=2874478 RepID=UPI001CC48FEB|nr:type II secretion system F family protein [Nocardioides sp. TRM66260-LWL]MBZ5734308.1 type II secretion system F family protein [Nocardioides sp. TRM66260-LWL]
MSRRLASLALVVPAALAGLLGLAPVAATAAAPDGTADISHVEVTDAGVEMLVSVPRGADVRLDGVTATIAGQPAGQVSAQPASATDAVRRTTVLVVDTSPSMRGERFAAAKQAAATFLDTVPDDVEVGIVSFAGDITVAQPPTLDHAAARTVLDSLRIAPRTRLYDGVLRAVRVAGTEGQRRLLVLSDGADTSTTSLASVVATLRRTRTQVDAIALDAGTPSAALSRLAAAGRGTVIAADRADLEQAFAGEADALDRQIVVSATRPAGLSATSGTVSVTVPTATGTLTADAYATIGRAAIVPASAPSVPSLGVVGPGLPSWALYAGVGVLGVGLLGLLVLLVPRAPQPLSAADRVSRYTSAVSGLGGGQAGLPKIDPDQAIAQAKDAATQMLHRNRDLETRIARRLDAAGSEMKPAEWLLVHLGVFVAAALLGLLLSAGNLLLGLLVVVLGAVGPWIVLGVRGARRRRRFAASLPDTLQLMSGALAAGLSLQQAVDTIVKEGSDPIAGEFRRVMVETRLGVSVEEALDGVAERFESKDFEWVVMAIRIQRQVGGNLAELLDTVAATMREREYMRRQVASLSAEGRLSAWVLGCLPGLFLLYLVLTQGSYVAPLFHDPRGWVLLGGGTLWLSLGVFWMSRLVKVEV